MAALGLEPEALVIAGAVHGAEVARADGAPGVVVGVDGLVTDVPGLPLFALYADCYPLVLYSRARHCAGLGHAGWRGTAAAVAGGLVGALIGEYGCDPGELIAGIGPGICAGCYEVGPEVARLFDPGVATANDAGGFRLDLAAANRRALVAAGVAPGRIHEHGACTRESTELFSHRRSGDGRRFAGVVALR